MSLKYFSWNIIITIEANWKNENKDKETAENKNWTETYFEKNVKIEIISLEMIVNCDGFHALTIHSIKLTVWPDLAKFYHFGKNLKKRLAVVEGVFSSWQNFESTLAKDNLLWGKISLLKRAKFVKNVSIWSHLSSRRFCSVWFDAIIRPVQKEALTEYFSNGKNSPLLIRFFPLKNRPNKASFSLTSSDY